MGFHMKQVSFLGSVSKQVIDQFAKSVVTLEKSQAAEDKVISKAVDTMRLAYETADTAKGLTRAQWASLRAPKAVHKVEVTAMFKDCAGITDAHRKNLATAFWAAFESGQPFDRRHGPNKSEAKSEAEKKPKTGKVEVTDRAALDKTLSKALHQARLLGLTEFAAIILDHCIDSLDDFKEITE
jgi:hypothetical protein